MSEWLSEGARLIAAERARQMADEGWTPEHDDKHQDDVLAMAAVCYALPVSLRTLDAPDSEPPTGWPWGSGWWKPSPDDRVRELVKAGALIAAEIDRLQRSA